MKSCVTGLLALLLVVGTCFAADKPMELKSEEQKLSYAMGLEIGKYLKGLGEKFDLTMLQKGIADRYDGRKALLSDEEAAAVKQAFAMRQQEKKMQQMAAMLTKNHKAAEEFLKANKVKEGVVETTSGLQYKILKKGQGPKPAATDIVKVHYKGTLLGGQEFDSSYKRGEPAKFQVNQVISGWQEAMTLMPVGSTYELYIPPDLAYGDRGAMPTIEPGSLLVFQVELLGIEEKEAK